MLQHENVEVSVLCTQMVVEFLQNLPRMISQSAPTQSKKVCACVFAHLKLSELLYTVPQYSHLPAIIKAWKSSILNNLKHAVPTMRMNSLRILYLEIKQGLEYPVDCIELVISLLLDSNPEVEFHRVNDL